MTKRLTIQDVLDRKKPKKLGGYYSIFEFGKYVVSIVGGTKGLYGDFETTFEVAIIDKNSRNFVTKLFCGGADVMGYCTIEKVEDILNTLREHLLLKNRLVELIDRNSVNPNKRSDSSDLFYFTYIYRIWEKTL